MTPDTSPLLLVPVTVEISPDRRSEFSQLVQEFNAGQVRAITPPLPTPGQSYRAAVRDLVRSSSTSHTLRKRLIEDDGRDALDTLADAETLHAVQSARFTETAPIGAADIPSAGGLDEYGVESPVAPAKRDWNRHKGLQKELAEKGRRSLQERGVLKSEKEAPERDRDQPEIEKAGIPALKRPYKVGCGNSGLIEGKREAGNATDR